MPKLFNRDFAMYKRNLAKIPMYLVYFPRCFLVFRKPFQFIFAYLRMQPPKDAIVALRNGIQIYLSGHPHDIVTIFLIFIREDYGRPGSGSVVVDVGANIGVYSLFAVHCGARKVLAYEPNSEAFRCLEKNILANHLEDVIFPHRLAVTGAAGQNVRFPKASSAYNRILAADSTEAFDLVETTDLAAILQDADRVNLLKLDCEGAEREILFGSSRSLLDRIDAIRMEYHLGLREEMTSFLQAMGFARIFQSGTKVAGTMWFSRKSPLDGKQADQH